MADLKVRPVRPEAGAPSAANESKLREQLGKLLADGLLTAWQHRAYSDLDIQAVTALLRQVPAEDLAAKLQIAGFTPHPYGLEEEPDPEQSCAMCMYFERNREYCNLPELALPVRPEWSCILWRI